MVTAVKGCAVGNTHTHTNTHCIKMGIRWAAMKAILMAHWSDGQIESRDTVYRVYRPQLLKSGKESQTAGNRTEALLLTSLTPYR